ncbi:MAG: hypothetical protein STSR0007_08550 [Thermovirga sp.]
MTLSMGVDVFFVLILATFCIRGAIRGFSGEAISLVTTIGGFLLAWKLSPQFSGFLVSFLPVDPTASKIGSLVVIYVVVLILGVYVGRGVKAFLKFTNLSSIDRGMGIVAGAVKTFAVLVIVFAVVMALSPVLSTYWMEDSYSMRIAHWAWPAVQKSLSGVRLMDPDSLPWSMGSGTGSEGQKDGKQTN